MQPATNGTDERLDAILKELQALTAAVAALKPAPPEPPEGQMRLEEPARDGRNVRTRNNRRKSPPSGTERHRHD